MVVSDPKDVDKQRLLTKKNQRIIVYVTVSPHASSRLIATESEISQTSIIKILRNYKFYFYHMSFH